MSFEQTFVSRKVMSLAECLKVIDLAKRRLPGGQEVLGVPCNEAELVLKSDWKSLLDISGIDFIGLISCSAKLPKKYALRNEFRRMLSTVRAVLPESYFFVREEFRLKSAPRGQENEEIQVLLDNGKIKFAYATNAEGVEEIKRIFDTVIAAADVPIRFEQRGRDYYLVPLRGDFEFSVNYVTSSENANPGKFICEMSCENAEDLLVKMAVIIEALGGSSVSKGEWYYAPASDSENKSSWRKELEFFAVNNFPFDEVEIITSYSLHNVEALGVLEKLAIKNTWFKTTVAIFDSPEDGPCELFIYTTSKGHQVFVSLADKSIIGAIQNVLHVKFSPSSMWD